MYLVGPTALPWSGGMKKLPPFKPASSNVLRPWKFCATTTAPCTVPVPGPSASRVKATSPHAALPIREVLRMNMRKPPKFLETVAMQWAEFVAGTAACQEKWGEKENGGKTQQQASAGVHPRRPAGPPG